MRRRSSTVLLGVFVATSLSLVAGMSPVGAGAPCVTDSFTVPPPDGKIKLQGDGKAGGGEYPFATLDAETLVMGERAPFRLKWKNVTDATRTIKVTIVDLFPVQGILIEVSTADVPPSEPGVGDKFKFKNVPPGGRGRLKVDFTQTGASDVSSALVAEGKFTGAGPMICDRLAPTVNNFND